MDANGNLITVTPTPTPFPVMAGNAIKFSDDAPFPWKPVLIGIIIIAVLGTRYVMLKNRGLRGGNLVLEFVPGVSDIVDKIQRRGTKIEQKAATDKYDYSNSTAARAAEAAREAQLARAEFAKAQQERMMANPTTQLQGTRTPVKRPPSANATRTPTRPGAQKTASQSSAPKGIKTNEGFKFVAPVASQFAKDDEADAPSPFKKIDDPGKDKT